MKILFYRIGSLGDSIVAIPCLYMICQRYGGSEVTLLTNRPNSQNIASSELVFRRSGKIDNVLYFPLGSLTGIVSFLIKLRKERFDLLVYMAPSRRSYIQRFRDRLFFSLAGIRKIVGMRGYSIGGDEQKSERDILQTRLLAEGFDAPELTDAEMLIDDPTEADHACEMKRLYPEPWLAICMGTQNQMRKWPVEKFARCIKSFVDFTGWMPVFFGGERDASEADWVISEVGKGINLCGSKLRIEMMRKCNGYFGHDTGVMHLAAMLNVRCVSIFASYQIDGRWHPKGDNNLNIRLFVPCQGCERSVCPLGHPVCLGIQQLDSDVVTENLLHHFSTIS